MTQQVSTRRDFIKQTALGLCAIHVAGRVWAASNTGDIPTRPLGSTGVNVSMIGLGGHHIGRIRDDNQSVRLIRKAIDSGVTFLDNAWEYHNGRSEELVGKALTGGYREKAFLMTKHHGRDKKTAMKHLEDSLRRLRTDVIDLWQFHEVVYEDDPEMIYAVGGGIEAADLAKKQGKARFIGFSSHDRRWIQFMIEYFPQVDVVCFPFTTMSKRAPQDSLFDALKKRDVGAFGIKPFAAASLFAASPQENNQRGRLAIRYILHSNTVIPIPGMNSIREVDNVIAAVKERRQLDLKESATLEHAGRQAWAKLPAQYQWLKDWQYV